MLMLTFWISGAFFFVSEEADSEAQDGTELQSVAALR